MISLQELVPARRRLKRGILRLPLRLFALTNRALLDTSRGQRRAEVREGLAVLTGLGARFGSFPFSAGSGFSKCSKYRGRCFARSFQRVTVPKRLHNALSSGVDLE
jgi:hypothetical protein